VLSFIGVHLIGLVKVGFQVFSNLKSDKVQKFIFLGFCVMHDMNGALLHSLKTRLCYR